MDDIIHIARSFVKRGPYWYWAGDHEEHKYQALCCDLANDDEFEMEDECNHEEDCPWRLAREYLENMNNE